ncbi:MAG: hypothetical protein ACRDPZ_13225 [Gaiellaceae bacterium]
MRRRALSFTVAVVCLALGASACGGDDSDESSDASSAVIEQIDGICTDWKQALDARGDFPVEGFDPENPSQQDLPAVGDYFASGHAAAEEAIANLRQLSPPADIDAEVEALISALDQGLASAKAQASAAQAGDVAAFTATLSDVASLQEAVEDAADELGVDSCAF